MSLEVVEVLRDFQVHNYCVRAGTRVMAWRESNGGWVVSFNGNDIHVPEGTVGVIGAGPVKTEAKPIYSAARLEQYQVAPAKSS